MRRLFVLTALLFALPAHAVIMEWVTVGDPGNAADVSRTGLGAVAYPYRIGKYEVTNAQYAEFLNAVDPTGANALALYNPNMGPGWFGGIDFESGNPDGLKYVVKSEMSSKPVNYVDIFDSLRFANWLNNGQGTASTETGAYTLLGGTPLPSNWETVTRNAGASVFLPGEDEWYKAEYFDGTGYFLYPAGSDAQIGCVLPSADTGNSANCNLAVDHLTDVGAYSLSGSPYGTFDQGGNVWEQIETRIGPVRHVQGGGYWDEPVRLAAGRALICGSGEFHDLGFRVASLAADCEDGLDNDGDGLTDFVGGDPGCADEADLSERSPLLVCDDGADNDNDGRIDFDPMTYANPGDRYTLPAGFGDPGCKSPSYLTESPQCQDGMHNDFDGAMDYDAGLSANGAADANGPDPQCLGKPWKNREQLASSCGLGIELTLLLPPLMWLYRRRGRRT